MLLKHREYEHGMQWCVWRWKDIEEGGRLYLRRLHVFQCPLFSIMIHWFHSPDRNRHLHDHPVDMLSIVLRGWYLEEEPLPQFSGSKTFPTGMRVVEWLNWIPHKKIHRIVGVYGDPVTLCIAGPRRQEWGFYTEEGWVHWKEYK